MRHLKSYFKPFPARDLISTTPWGWCTESLTSEWAKLAAQHLYPNFSVCSSMCLWSLKWNMLGAFHRGIYSSSGIHEFRNYKCPGTYPLRMSGTHKVTWWWSRYRAIMLCCTEKGKLQLSWVWPWPWDRPGGSTPGVRSMWCLRWPLPTQALSLAPLS